MSQTHFSGITKMRITYHIYIQASTLTEAVEKIGLNGNIIGQPSVVANSGAGTELKNIIARFGLKPGFNCKCGQHIREMDTKGVEWCAENIDTITGWLREEAQQANLPFTEIGAKLLIRRAISNARKKQKGEQEMTVKLVIEIDAENVYEAFERTKPKEGKVIAATAEPPRQAAQQKPTGLIPAQVVRPQT